MVRAQSWKKFDNNSGLSCYAEPDKGVAYFDGIVTEADTFSDPRQDRVEPTLEEEQIFMCRQMSHLLKEGSLVLDVGTGSGVLAIWAAKHSCQVIAIDINPRALRVAKNNAKNNNVNIGETTTQLENLDFNNIEDGTIYFYLEEFNKEFVDKYQQKFDFVFISPPYTPTFSDLPVAHHAAGSGEDGQKWFSEKIRLIPKILKEKGYCIGEMMSTVTKNKEITALTKIQEAFNYQCDIKYTKIIEDDNTQEYIDDNNVKTDYFLRNQYKDYFLVGLINNDFDKDKFEEYVKDISSQYPEFSLIYYEVIKQSTDNKIESKPKEINKIFQPNKNKNWDYRIQLHREVVSFISPENSVPWPAMFLEKALSFKQLHLSFSGLNQEKSWNNSLLRYVELFIKNNIFTKSKNYLGKGAKYLFDMVTIDTAPSYPSIWGEKGLLQESKVWINREFYQSPKVTEKTLNQIENELAITWQLNTLSCQKARVSHFLHPYYTGEKNKAKFKNIFSTILPNNSLPSPNQHLEITIDDLTRNAISDPNFLRNIKFDNSISGYSWANLIALGVVEHQKYINEGVKTRANILETNYDRDFVYQDINNCHWAIHHKIDGDYRNKLSSVYNKISFKWSILIYLPFCPSFIKQLGQSNWTTDYTDYRGGAWIFLCSSSEWTYNHQKAAIDLLRFVWFLFESQYNLETSINFEELLKTKSEATFAHQIKHLAAALSDRWLLEPHPSLKTLADQLADGEEWLRSSTKVYPSASDIRTLDLPQNWKILLFPELLNSTANTMRLWCQLNDPKDIFEEDEIPQNIEHFIQKSFQFIKDAVKPSLLNQFRFNYKTDIESVRLRLLAIDQLWEKLFNIDVKQDNIMSKSWYLDEKQKEIWMTLFRIFTISLDNCFRYAHPQKNIDIIVDIQSKILPNSPNSDNQLYLYISISNYPDVSEDNGLDSYLNNVRINIKSSSLISKGKGLKGTDIRENLIKELGGFSEENSTAVQHIYSFYIPYYFLRS